MAVATRMAGRFRPQWEIRPALVNAAGAGVGSNKIVFQTSLKIGLLAELLEEGEADVGVLKGHVARPQERAAGAGGLAGAETCGEEAEGAAGALKIGDGRPALAHQVDEGWVEGIG
jgi:hypothetical protein